MSKIFHWLLCSSLFVCLGPSVGLTALKPTQIAVLANQQSLESLALADYYMTQRKIPLHHRIDVDLPLKETLSRQEFEERLIAPLAAELKKKGLENQIRVLVTLWGIPLRVEPPQSNAEELAWIEDGKQWKRSAISLIDERLSRLRTRMPQSLEGDIRNLQLSEQGQQSSSLNTETIQKWKAKVRETLAKAQSSLEGNTQPPSEKALLKDLDGDIRQLLGKIAIMKNKGTSGIRPSAEFMRVYRAIQSLMHQPTSVSRSNAYAVVQEYFGLFGVLAFADWEILQYGYSEGVASVDSELSFLWWGSETYPISGKLPNPFYIGFSMRPEDWPLPIIMVSRLDAPSVLRAQGMIDDALEVEKHGLEGKAYIDSRGLPAGPKSSYGFYDLNMQDFAQQLKRGSEYRVVWENSERRFSRPGQAPQVALYVGWYKLRSYEDAFQFNPGALGYHIASGEAVSVHNPQETGWCKNALERGIAVTLGPVGEPYLDAFPLPKEFFGLLFSGKYSLVEAFYLSKRYLSWKMVLFGDPLYRPWASPSRRLQKLSSALLDHRPFPKPPAQSSWPSPSIPQKRQSFPGKYRPVEPGIFR